MNKLLIPSLCCIFTLQAMENNPVRQPREWDAELYAKGNRLQEDRAFKILQEYTIDITGKDILDIGCGTGNISAALAKTAKKVHGIDASHNMINFAREHYGNMPKLSFEYCFAEDFSSDVKRDLCVVMACLHWVQDKKMAFQKMYDVLKSGGQVIGTIVTTSHRPSKALAVFNEMMQTEPMLIEIEKNRDKTKMLARSELTDQELDDMLHQVGFSFISIKKGPWDGVFKDRQEIMDFQRPIIFSRPFVQMIPEDEREAFFNGFIDRYIDKLEKSDEGFLFSEETTILLLTK